MDQPRSRSSDSSVRETNDDAATSKLSACNAGYWKDPFLRPFVRRPMRRPPIINRGYFLRVWAIRQLISKFIAACKASGKKSQIVSLGAGYDTTYFQLCKEDRDYSSSPSVLPDIFVEIDFPSNVSMKRSVIAKTPDLASLIPEIDSCPSSSSSSSTPSAASPDLITPRYKLIGADLRQLDSLKQKLQDAEVSFEIPTLVLSECVLIYLEPTDSQRLIQFVSDTFLDSVCFVTYEQILPNDAFGQQMIRNLQDRGCPLLSIDVYPTLESQRRRYTDAGYAKTDAWDMNEIHDRSLPLTEKQRIDRLEMLDELEEWRLISAHYCIVLARKTSTITADEDKVLDSVSL